MVDGGASTLYYLFTDHLGSTSEARRADGSLHSRQGYKAFGEKRFIDGALPTDRTYTGQREIENGLVHYGARVYDPALGRFAQADTIIPQPGNPMAWDRFAYTNNGPIRYADPTGHKVCDSVNNDGVCINTGIPNTLSQVIVTLRSYGVKLVSRGETKWTLSDAYSAYLGVYDLASAMARVSLNSATETFKRAFGPMTFNVRSDLSYFGIASDGNIDFQSGRVTQRLTVHELGHSFERHMWSAAGGVYEDDNPIMMLGSDGIYDANGSLITGKGNRYNGQRAVVNGYKCDSYVGECQYHSLDVAAWNDSSEDFSDILMNWTYKSFASNPAGVALYSWVETNMADWLGSGE